MSGGSKALHDIEWVDSADYCPGEECEAIRLALKPPVLDDDDTRVVELHEKFWRKVREIVPDGYYEHDGARVEITPAPKDAKAGLYQAWFDGISTIFISPSTATVNTTAKEFVEWVKSITGWCGDVDRLLEGD